MLMEQAPQTTPLTPQQVLYVAARMEGLSQRQAYLRSYPRSRKWKDATVDRAAWALEHTSKISTRLDELKTTVLKNALWSREMAVGRAQTVNSMSYSILEARGLREALNGSGLMEPGFIDREANTAFWDSFDRLNKIVGIKEGAEEEASAFTADFGLLLPASYVDIHRAINAHAFIDYAFEGGRGSGKSSAIALEVVRLLLGAPERNVVVIRKVFNTLRKSAYAQVKWAISRLGLHDDFAFTTSPMEIRCKPTGQRIYFLGLDDPEKVKSFTCEQGYAAIHWYEEFSQLSLEDVRSVSQSLSRGGADFWRFYSWNPPRSKSNWVNEWVRSEAAERTTHHSDYRDVPVEWLGEQFIADAEALLAINELAYRHEYLGEPVGTDGEVFQNHDIREITDEEMAECDFIRCGCDWGYYPDPWVFGQVGYNHKTRTVYIRDEAFGTRLSDLQAAEKAIEIMSEDVERGGEIVREFNSRLSQNEVYCDSAEPKSIASFRELGINALPVKKFKGSIDAGIKWLQTRAQIVIDPKTAPLSAQEFYAYEYEEGSDGAVRTYPDRNNHSIDKARYALAPLIAARKEV